LLFFAKLIIPKVDQHAKALISVGYCADLPFIKTCDTARQYEVIFQKSR